MNSKPVIRDERTDAVVGTSCRLAWLVLYFGVLIIAAVRLLAFRQVCLDLLGVVFVSSVVGIVYQLVKRVQVVPWRWVLLFALAPMVVGLAIALLQLLTR
jgi:hypothetical protein